MSPETFADLLDRATETPPPPPGSALAAGRRRLLRRRAGVAAVGLAAAVAVTTGSLLAGAPQAADDPSRVVDEPTTTAGPGDARVLDDVVDAAFPTPGEAALRNIRVHTFIRSWGVDQCGGTGSPVDSTADRFEQDVLPNLELIREKGFTEPPQESFKGARDGCEIGDVLQAAAPAFEDWFALAGPWHELVQGTLDDPGLTALKAPMADCLRAATGLVVSDRDPATSFVGAVDGTDSSERSRDAAAYADCGADYFGELEQLLLAQRPAYVALHRPLLERFAAQLVTLGYTP